jgi:thiol:disulfide interchange protein
MCRVFIFFLSCSLFVLACAPSKKPARSAAKPLPSRPSAPANRPQPRPAEIPVAAAVRNIAWLDSERLMPVLEQAQREKKPVFVEFHASWCAPCKVMEEEIFTQSSVFQYLNGHFLNFRTDFDTPAGRTIAEIYEVEKLPTVLFLDPRGVVLGRHTGIANASLLKTLGDAALAKTAR